MTIEHEHGAELRLAELVAAFSLATDLGLGQPMEHVLRSWLIASRLGELAGLEEDERSALYYVAMLAWVGCVVDTPEIASWFGDDIAYRGDSYEVDLAGLPMLGFLLRHVGAGSPALHRLRLAATLVVTGGRSVERILQSHCMSTAQLADRLGLGATVRDPLHLVFTRWDGKGVPGGVGGADIPLTVRLIHLADIVEVFHRSGGVDAAVDVARERRGKQFDPALVDLFCRSAPEVLGDVTSEPDWDALIAGAPALQQRLGGAELDDALEAVADFTDLRSPSRAGHSRGVAELAGGAARHAHRPEADVVAVRRAGLLHDLGMHGVPSTILEKPGPLTATESERVRMHAYYTGRVLTRPDLLARLGVVAGMAHERVDGSGYHRGLAGTSIPAIGRILAAADAFRAMTEPRPYRPAMTAKQAAAELHAEARAGRFSDDAVDAVLAAAGEKRGKRRSGPSGLTPREIEVLTLIARGRSNREVAASLGITPKTAGTHIERIYTKTGASSRPAATLFALRHGLLDTLEPLDS